MIIQSKEYKKRSLIFWNRKRNTLVIFYEGCIEPEVEWNIFISFRETLRVMRTDHMNLIHKLSFNIGERWKSKHSLHSIQTWPSHLLQPQVHSAGWWLLRYYPHQEIPNKTHKRVKTLKLFNPVVWICECVTDLPCSSPAWHTHTQTPALFSQLSWPWNRYHYLYQRLSRSRGRKKKKAHMCHCWWCSYKRTWFRFSSLPAMEWIRMLLILRLFGGGSCLLNLFFMIS